MPPSWRPALALLVVAAWLAVTWFAGLRQGFTFLIGIGLGSVLAGVSFGFTTAWRVWLRERDPTGLLAQFVAIGVAMAISIPRLAALPCGRARQSALSSGRVRRPRQLLSRPQTVHGLHAARIAKTWPERVFAKRQQI